MTRDEAIKKFAEGHNNYQTGWAERWVDMFVSLGMLKLDEPKSLDARINYAINYEMCSNKTVQAREIKAALDRAGLKIVEK